MTSLSSRLLVSVSVLLLVFFGATIAVLDRAFTEAGEQARRDILDGHLVALLAAAAAAIAIGSKFLELGEDRLYETIRFWTMSVAEYLDEYFETDVIKAAMSGSGIIGTALGIHSPGTAYVLLHHVFGEANGQAGQWGHAIGGMGAITQAMRIEAECRGVVIRTDAPVAGDCAMFDFGHEENAPVAQV